MKKMDILKVALGVAGMMPGPVGAVAGGVSHLVHRDDDPTNDLEETATALAEVFVDTVAVAEDLQHKDFVDNEVLAALTASVKAQLLADLQLIHKLKPKKV